MQVRSIIGQVRPDRQTLLFSATMPNKVERLVADCLTSPVRVTVGEIGAANADIRQAGLLESIEIWMMQSTSVWDAMNFGWWCSRKRHYRCMLCCMLFLQHSEVVHCVSQRAGKRGTNVGLSLSLSALKSVQVAEVLEDGAKWAWLQAHLQTFIDAGDVLLFAATKARVDELTAQLQAAGTRCAQGPTYFTQCCQ